MSKRSLDLLIHDALSFPVSEAPLQAIHARAERAQRRRTGRSAALALAAVIALVCFAARGESVLAPPLSQSMFVATPAPAPAPSPELT